MTTVDAATRANTTAKISLEVTAPRARFSRGRTAPSSCRLPPTSVVARNSAGCGPPGHVRQDLQTVPPETRQAGSPRFEGIRPGQSLCDRELEARPLRMTPGGQVRQGYRILCSAGGGEAKVARRSHSLTSHVTVRLGIIALVSLLATALLSLAVSRGHSVDGLEQHACAVRTGP